MVSPGRLVFKFGTLDGDDLVPFTYPGVYEQQKTKGPDRLTLAPAADQIELLLNLSAQLKEPFGILYVLLVTHTGATPARYQCPGPLSRSQVRAFFTEFQTFFETDGRHNIWLASPADAATLVYDKHNVIHAYGPLERFGPIITTAGLKKGKITIPSPHVHKYNVEFDEYEQNVMNYWEWKSFPLQPVDDDPR